jgi:triosephosphate isomerase
MRRPFICGNWKMHKTVSDALAFVTELKSALGSVRDVDVAVAPPFTAIQAVAKRLEDSHITVAGQDCHWESKGAFTGEVSAPMLAEAGARHVILGHSERRHVFGETDAEVQKKMRAVLDAGLSPILCVGEKESERDGGQTQARVQTQLEAGLEKVKPEELARVTVAYEPVWAIGTGRTATPEQAEEVHAFIRAHLAERFGTLAEIVRIQYGGSVKPDNVAALMAKPNVDGALVGGAALETSSFVALVKYRRD